jgi:ubiquinone/menaquinone biosynthesis C-methylase UbiE
VFGAASDHPRGTGLASISPGLVRPAGATIVAEKSLPAYHQTQTAFHEAFRAELYRCLDGLPLAPDSRVLDVPCGDGFYSARLVTHLGRQGRLTLADASEAYLQLAAATLALPAGRTPVDFRQVNVYDLPFGAGEFDLVWCARSLITLDDPESALRELARVTRPRGILAVLEGDEFHHLLLPWPVELELSVLRALQQASRDKYGDAGRLAPSRRVRRHLLGAGLRQPRKVSFAADRYAPFDAATARFLRLHLAGLADLVRAHLRDTERLAFDAFIDPEHPRSIHNRPDGELTCLNVVHLARKPAYRRGRRRDDPQTLAG